MLKLYSDPSGRHFLHVPGPGPVPARILRAINFPPLPIAARSLVNWV